MKKKRFTVLTVLLVCGCLAACGGRKKQQEQVLPETESNTETVQQETQPQQETEAVGHTQTQEPVQGSVQEMIYEVAYENNSYQAEDKTVIFTSRLAYPVFVGEQENVKNINAFFENWKREKLADYEYDDDSSWQLALAVYRESKDSGWKGPWSEEYMVSRIDMHENYINVLLDSYLYEGGNHGMPCRESFWFRKNDGKKVSLLRESGLREEEWETLLEQKFRERIRSGESEEFYPEAEQLLAEVDWDDVDAYLGENGIVFYLPPYEIGPYSSGYAEVELTFEEIFGKNES